MHRETFSGKSQTAVIKDGSVSGIERDIIKEEITEAMQGKPGLQKASRMQLNNPCTFLATPPRTLLQTN